MLVHGSRNLTMELQMCSKHYKVSVSSQRNGGAHSRFAHSNIILDLVRPHYCVA